jgi:hypothetical protein
MWSHYDGWPARMGKGKSGLIIMGDLPRGNDGLIVWVTNPRKIMVSLYGWRTQEKWWSHCMGDEPKKNDGLIVWVTYPRKIMVSLYGWPTQEKWWSHCMGDEPKKNNGLIVWVTYPRGRILSKLHAFLRNSFNTRSLLATFLDECRSTRSFLVISNNLESHRAIPFTKAKTWSSF